MGINTNTCVQCAAFESLNRDLKTIVIAEGVHSM
jgi:nicotinamidase-related amidase